MATNHTTNYQLNLWEPDDAFLRTEFNENSNKIDAALGKLNTAVNQHTSTLSGHTSTLNNHTATLTSHDSAIGERLRCVTGSYTGTGAANWSINFGVEPKLVLIAQNGVPAPCFCTLIRGQSAGSLANEPNSNYGFTARWSGTQIQFSGSSQNFTSALQKPSCEYLYFAFY